MLERIQLSVMDMRGVHPTVDMFKIRLHVDRLDNLIRASRSMYKKLEDGAWWVALELEHARRSERSAD